MGKKNLLAYIDAPSVHYTPTIASSFFVSRIALATEHLLGVLDACTHNTAMLCLLILLTSNQ